MNSAHIFKTIYDEAIGRRPGAADFMKWLLETDFFTAPASTRHHLAQPGGLVEHSVNVFNRLWELKNCMMDRANYSRGTLAVCGLLHDVCKAGVYQQEPKNRKTYEPEKIAAAQSWQVKHDAMGDYVWETVMGYTFDDPFPYGHGEKSVYLISRFMPLSDEEAMAIRYHMSSWQDGEARNAAKAFEKYPLAFLLHVADEWATFVDEVDK